jgi:uncharacterized membrane protein
MLLATVRDGPYKFVLILHILTVIIGFGGVFLNGVYGELAKNRKGSEGAAIAEATYTVSVHWAEWFIYAVPIFGILLVLQSDKVWKFSQAWISIALLLYVIALGIVHGAHLPNIRRMNALMGELAAMGPPPAGAAMSGPPPQVAELEARGRRAAALGGALNLIVVVIVVLMVWKPGT